MNCSRASIDPSGIDPVRVRFSEVSAIRARVGFRFSGDNRLLVRISGPRITGLRDCDGSATILRLIGQTRSRTFSPAFDRQGLIARTNFWILSKITLVDLGVIWFLIRCEDEGIELAKCPHYASEWVLREEERKKWPGQPGQPTQSHGSPYLGDMPSVAGVPFVIGWRYNFGTGAWGSPKKLSDSKD
jgi:hypothetical protein